MKQQLILNINMPCSEKFNKFDKTKQGGFCNTYKKEVIDFRNMTATELIKFFEDNRSTTCGIFKTSQMKTYSQPSIPRKKRHSNYLTVLGFVVLSLFAFQNMEAQQTNTPTEVKTSEQVGLLTGTVLDHDNLPLPNMSIVLKGTKVGTTTNFEGEYTFPQKLKEGDILIFSSLGYSPKRIKIGKDQTVLNVVMEAELVELMGAVDTNKAYKSKRTLWQKIKAIF
ncbi:carboxypeptidase-like regulatory domain-containing protein [Seonamhaeicola sp.]|uniref:carboxypeptidase-like regulatory domain-containing protein n=1 Tax=Seonamhaeicola sp. TaxID=1912245 RepID=UPI0026189056|nr:carboxypeptidase-like regulatory domain-containing protein [Seonamhaeicola sp.]